MATGESILNTSEEVYDYICTSCAEDDLIKEALNYCVDCQRYCCLDCINIHKKVSVTKGHSFFDNSAVKPQGHSMCLPAFPTKQCSKHAGKIMDMFCKNHNVVCCYICVTEDHRSCEDTVSVSDTIGQLYSKTYASKTTSDVDRMLDNMNGKQDDNDTLLQQLRNSKQTAIKAANDHRMYLEQLLRKLEEITLNEIENEYKILETQLLKERKKYEDFIHDLKNLKRLLVQAFGNKAQKFVCSKLAQQCIKTIKAGEIASLNFYHVEVQFQPSEVLKANIESKTSLGQTCAMLLRNDDLYKVTRICDMNIKLQDDSSKCCILGSCIIDNTVLFTDFLNNQLKCFDILSLSPIDYCKVPNGPRGVCRVGEEVAVACKNVVQFISIHDKLSLSHSIKMNHESYGIAFNDDKLYITDGSRALYMYDMSGNLLKTVTSDNDGQALFENSYHITFSDKKDILFVGDDDKGLVCFNAQCDYMKTITDPDVRPYSVCIDDVGNVIAANYKLQTIVQCGRDGQKQDVIVNKIDCNVCQRSVCINRRLKRMFVSRSNSNDVRVFRMY
ncbi:hypothetical protein ACF0H5_021846 [Mactra antiquata]